MELVKVHESEMGVMLDREIASFPNARLLICKDYRPLNIFDLANIFLRSVAKIDGFFVFCYVWQKKRLRAVWSPNELVVQRLTSICTLLDRHPTVAATTTVYVGERGVRVCLPKKEFLVHVKGTSIVDDVRNELESWK